MNRIIVSLTSFPARINTVHLCLKSIIKQNFVYDKIVLWLAESQFPDRILPSSLIELAEEEINKLCIEWCSDLKSYKKLIPALKKYPDDVIITADDDIIYPDDWLQRLVLSYNKDPNYIYAMRCHRIKISIDGHLLKYKDWDFEISHSESPRFINFPTTGGGVLFPPNCFSNSDVLDKNKFMKYLSKGDDIWFWGHAIINGYKIKAVIPNIGELNTIDGSQESSLWENNINFNNDIMLKNLLNFYPALTNILRKDFDDYMNTEYIDYLIFKSKHKFVSSFLSIVLSHKILYVKVFSFVLLCKIKEEYV